MASVVSVSPGQTGAFDPSGLPVATVTGAWTLVPSEFSAFMVDATNGAFAATLPEAASWVGAPIVIKAITATANLVTVSDSTANIDGASAITLGAAGSGATYLGVSLTSDGAQWRATAVHGPIGVGQLPPSVVSVSSATAGQVAVPNGSGLYNWEPPGTIRLDVLPGVDPTGATDSSTAVLAAIAAARGAGFNGANKLVWVAPGTTLLLSQPIPLYNGFRLLGDPLGSGTTALNPTVTIKNGSTDIFTMPTSAVSGTLEDVRICGFHFYGTSLRQNTHIITPQPTDASGWVINDLYFLHNGWDFFQSALSGAFLRLHLLDFNGNNGSSTQLNLAGADSEIGIERSFLGSMLIGNTSHWPTVTSGQSGSWVLNNIVGLADVNGNVYYFRCSTPTSTAPTVAAPISTSSWIYMSTQVSGSSGASAYNSGTVYGTIGTLVTWGGSYYYNLTAQATSNNPPPGTTTSGANCSTALWGWLDTSLGSLSDPKPCFLMLFEMAQSELSNVYPTACPSGGIKASGICSGSRIQRNHVNGYAPGVVDNSGNQLRGSDVPGILVFTLTSTSSSPGPTGLLRVDDNTVTNCGQGAFSYFAGMIQIQDSAHVGCDRNEFICIAWTGGPSILTVNPYQIGQASATTTDITIANTKWSGNAPPASWVAINGTITKLTADWPGPITYASGTNTIQITGQPAIIAGGTNSLPAASAALPGQPFPVINATVSPVTLGSAGGNINNASTLSVPADSAIIAYSDGANWWAT